MIFRYCPHFALILLVSLLSSCSLFTSAPEPETRSLDQLFSEISPSAWEQLDNSENQLLYYSSDHEGLFGAAIRDCAIVEKTPLATQFRQLFVGLSEFQIVSRQPLTVPEGEGLSTLTYASYAKAPIVIATASYKRNGCLVDLIFWNPRTAGSGASEYPARATRDRAVAQLLAHPELLEELTQP